MTLSRALPYCLVVATGLASLAGAVVPTLADDHWQELHGDVQRGEVVPLEDILDWLDEHYRGEVLEVELERDDDEAEYEIKMIGPQDQIVEFEFDAISGQLMAIEGVNINGMMRE